VTARDIAEVFRTNAKTVTKALQSIGFETETDHISVRRKEGSPVRKTIKKLVVPSIQVWREITRRYWFSDESSTPPSCPDVLRGNRWIDPQMKLYTPLSTSAPCVPCVPKSSDQSCAGTLGTHGTDKERVGGIYHQSAPQIELPQLTNDEILHDAGISAFPDITKYARIHNPDKIIGRCIWKLCDDSPMWGEGGNLKNPLCDGHYHIIKNSANEDSSNLISPFAKLLQEYGLPPDIRLSNHVLVYQPDSCCIVRGCSKESQWCNLTSDDRPLPLCGEHFESLRKAQKREEDYASIM